MSIQSEINRIKTNVQNTLDTLAQTGVGVPEGATSDDLPELVQNLANIDKGFPNGRKWTRSNITNKKLQTAYNGNGVWMAGGEDGLYKSTDGKEWTLVDDSDWFNEVYYENEIWVISGDLGLYYSTDDGETIIKVDDISDTIYPIYYGNGLFIAGSWTEYTMYYSSDGKVWTEAEVDSEGLPPNIGFRKIISGKGVFVAIPSGYSTWFYSLDGMSWMHGHYMNSYRDIHYSEGLFVAVVNDSQPVNNIYYSYDGISFQSVITLPQGGAGLKSVYKANGLWVAVGENANSTVLPIIYSTDVTHWYNANSTETNINELVHVQYANGIWLASNLYDQSGPSAVYYSYDGMNWHVSDCGSLPSGGEYYFAYSNGIWILCSACYDGEQGYGLAYSVAFEQPS